jgi:frataxin
MNNTEFKELALSTLQDLSDAIEEADKEYKLEVDLLDGILNIELPDGGQYVINKHDASMQIWLSSPISGAAHFSYNEGKWASSDGRDFLEVVTKELETKAGVSITL